MRNELNDLPQITGKGMIGLENQRTRVVVGAGDIICVTNFCNTVILLKGFFNLITGDAGLPGTDNIVDDQMYFAKIQSGFL